MLQFSVNGFIALKRVLGINARGINQMNQNPGSFNMAQKTDTQPGPLMCPFDQSGYIRNDKRLFLVGLNHTENRGEGCKWVICDFRGC